MCYYKDNKLYHIVTNLQIEHKRFKKTELFYEQKYLGHRNLRP